MSLKNIKLPEFNHPEVSIFYEHDLSIPKEKVEQILTLPRTTLIADMETIILDFLQRNELFKEEEEEDDWLSVHFHALWILVELKAIESLPIVFKFLEQDNEFSSTWFVDYTTEDLWEIYYHLGKHQLEQLKAILLAPGEWVLRIVPSTVAEQIYFHQPERLQEILDWYDSVLDAFLEMEDDDPALDPEVTSTIVADLVSLPSESLLPKIKALFDRGVIFEGIPGNYKSVERDIKTGDFTFTKRDLKNSIYERYEDAMSWHGYQMRYNEAYRERNTYKPRSSSESPILTSSKPYSTSTPTKVTTVKRKGKKIGRNDPCSCGSGKKYKKCCLRK